MTERHFNGPPGPRKWRWPRGAGQLIPDRDERTPPEAKDARNRAWRDFTPGKRTPLWRSARPSKWRSQPRRRCWFRKICRRGRCRLRRQNVATDAEANAVSAAKLTRLKRRWGRLVSRPNERTDPPVADMTSIRAATSPSAQMNVRQRDCGRRPAAHTAKGVIRRAASCALSATSAALNAWACVIALSVRCRQSVMNSPKKRNPTFPFTSMCRSPFPSAM